MKKTIFCTITCLAFTTSVFAASMTNLEGKETNGSISYLNKHITWDGNSVVKEIDKKVSDEWISGSDLIWKVDSKKGVRLAEAENRYLINENLALTGGFVYGRIYDNNDDSEVFHVAYGGIVYNQKVGDNITAYARYIKGTDFDDVRAGSIYAMNENSYVGCNYRNIKIKDATVLNGFAAEIGYKF